MTSPPAVYQQRLQFRRLTFWLLLRVFPESFIDLSTKPLTSVTYKNMIGTVGWFLDEKNGKKAQSKLHNAISSKRELCF
jgi:hypothetical protein